VSLGSCDPSRSDATGQLAACFSSATGQLAASVSSAACVPANDVKIGRITIQFRSNRSVGPHSYAPIRSIISGFFSAFAAPVGTGCKQASGTQNGNSATRRGIVRGQQPPCIRYAAITNKARLINSVRQDHGATGPGSACRLTPPETILTIQAPRLKTQAPRRSTQDCAWHLAIRVNWLRQNQAASCVARGSGCAGGLRVLLFTQPPDRRSSNPSPAAGPASRTTPAGPTIRSER